MTQSTSYDEVPYDSDPYPQSHPDQLATIATLLGVDPPLVDCCRVLELGCASGGNLIPMAESLPDSRFVGIDLSHRQIDDGQDVVQALQLKNIELRELDIVHAHLEDLGTFDYIICHGVYSWVPPNVQERILEICDRQLASNGVAYVSYNTFPGWHLRRMIRDMTTYHGRQFGDALERLKQCRKLLSLMGEQVARQSDPFSGLLRMELDNVDQGTDSYFFHEHLELFNSPIYFHQFVERAAASGLQYLGEASPAMMLPIYFSPEVAGMLQSLAVDQIHLEQYMDFLCNRPFRQTLLCHTEIPLQRQPNAERLTSFHVCYSGCPVPTTPNDDATDESILFRSQNGAAMSVNNQLVASALSCLAEIWPRSVRVDELRDLARERLSQPADVNTRYIDDQILAQWLLIAMSLPEPLVELRVSPQRFIADVSVRAQTSPLARLQAEQGTCVTNRRHQAAVLNELHRQLVLLSDGTRDRGAVYTAVKELIDDGVIQKQDSDMKVEDIVDDHLNSLAQAAFLID